MDKKIVTSGLIAGLAMLVAGLVLTPVYNIIFPNLQAEYMKAGLFRAWTDPLMSLYYLYPFLLGLTLSWVWDKTKKVIKGKTEFEKAKNFGLSYFLVAGLPGMFITYSSFQVSLMMVVAWSISGLIDAVIAGWIFAKKNP